MLCSFYQQKRSQQQQGRQQQHGHNQLEQLQETPPTAATSAEVNNSNRQQERHGRRQQCTVKPMTADTLVARATAQATAATLITMGAPSTGSQPSQSGIGIRVTGTAGHELFRHSRAMLVT